MASARGSGLSGCGSQRFPKSHRIRQGSDFKRVFDRRRSVADDVLIVYGCENDRSVSRLGLSVSRKLGHAHIRNHWKRLIREAFRRLSSELDAGFDFVVIPRRGISPDFRQVQQSLPLLLNRARKKLRKHPK